LINTSDVHAISEELILHLTSTSNIQTSVYMSRSSGLWRRVVLWQDTSIFFAHYSIVFVRVKTSNAVAVVKASATLI